MKVFNFDPRQDSTRNYAINGNFDFWQRGTSVTHTPVSNSFTYRADRIRTGVSTSGGASKSITVARSVSVPPTLTYPAKYSMSITNNFATSLVANDSYYPFLTIPEGQFVVELAGGNITFGLWIYSDVARTISTAVSNGAVTQSYVSTIAVSAGWGYYSQVVPFSGVSILNTTDAGMRIIIGAISGVNAQAPSLNSWIAGNYYTASTADNWAASTGEKLRFAQFQIRKGAVSNEDMKNSFSLFAGSYDNELRACQRYYEKSYEAATAPGTATGSGSYYNPRAVSGTTDYFTNTYVVAKRASAGVLTTYSVSTGVANMIRDLSSPADRAITVVQSSTTAFSFSASVVAGAPHAWHWVADSEF